MLMSESIRAPTEPTHSNCRADRLGPREMSHRYRRMTQNEHCRVNLAAWRYSPLFSLPHESQRVGVSCIARIGVAVDISEALSVGVHNLETTV